MTRNTQKEAEKKDAIERLRALLKPGSTVYTILRHVASSGMSRDISTVITTPDGIYDVTYLVARALEKTLREAKGGMAIRMGGCGMDMGFSLVYNLGRALFPDGFIPKEAGHRYGRNGEPVDKVDPDGGYALEHKWL